MSTISINGQRISVQGNGNLTISNNKIFINGKQYECEEKNINITIAGNVDQLKVDNCDTIKVAGNVNDISTMSGSVKVEKDVFGSIKTMSGSVKCNDVKGSVSTMSGDISKKFL